MIHQLALSTILTLHILLIMWNFIFTCQRSCSDFIHNHRKEIFSFYILDLTTNKILYVSHVKLMFIVCSIIIFSVQHKIYISAQFIYL